MAFVVAQHPASGHESALAELLARRTNLRVVEAYDGAAVEPNTIYTIRPNTLPGFEARRLKLSPTNRRQRSPLPVDHLFRSLAREYGARSAGVVLTGAGNDGTRGLRDIRNAGGLVIAQRPATAPYAGMPPSSVDAGVADLVLSIPEMPEALERFASAAALDAEQARARRRGRLLEPERLHELALILMERSDFDIKVYKEATIERRLIRRMALCGLPDLSSYLRRLQEESVERTALIGDLRIGVTDFFRDPEAFELLEREAVRPWVERTGRDEPLRAWVCGCATGEEAYSVAMLLLEAKRRAHKRALVRLFATDVDKTAVKVAREGCYSDEAARQIPKELLDRYFIPRVEGGYQAGPSLREVVTFATHDICEDPPLSRMGLVICRNVLIYLAPDRLEHVLDLLHFSLAPNGTLFLGSAESISPRSELFETTSEKWRIYRKLDAPRSAHWYGRYRFANPSSNRMSGPGRQQMARSRTEDASERARGCLIRACVPPAVIVAEDGEILYMHGELRPFLRLPEGGPRYELAALLDPNLQTRVRAACYKCRRDQEPVVAYSTPDDDRALRIEITVTPASEVQEGAVAVIFEKQTLEASQPGHAEQETEIDVLERELEATREDLSTTVQELETSNERLKKSDEASTAMNEELQASNEELESTSEELRSLNEELTVVNAQLEEKVEQLENARDDLANFFDSTRIATLFLDEDLCVRRYTPASRSLLRIGPADVGRSVEDIGGNLLQDGLPEAARAVLEGQPEQTAELPANEGRWVVRRVLPYRKEKRIRGVVITFVDVAELKAATERLAARERQQAVMARLGMSALETPEIRTFMDLAVREVRQTLGVDFCEILELQPDRESLLFRAAAGWPEGLDGNKDIPVGTDDQLGFTLTAREPVFVEDLPSDRRFTGPSILREHHCAGGLSVPIEADDAAYGVLGVHTRSVRRFTPEDASFLSSAAAVVARAVSRHHSRLRSSLESGATRILAEAKTLEAAVAGIHGISAKELGTTVGELWEPVRGELRRTLLSAESPHRKHQIEDAWAPISPSEGVIGQVMEQGRAEWITSSQIEHWVTRVERPRRIGLLGGVAFPIRANDQVLGVVTVLARHRLSGTEALLRTLESIGQSMGDFELRRRAEARSRHLAAIAGASHDAIMSCDFDGTVTGWNQAAEQMYGYSAREMLGASIDRIVPSDRREELHHVLEAIQRGEILEPFDTLRVAKGGELRTVSVRASPIFDEAGNVAGVSKVDRDVEEHRRAEKALAESERHFRVTFENAAVGMAQVALDGRWIKVNDRLLQITGYTRSELLARSFQQLIHPEDLQEELEQIQAMAEGRGAALRMEKRYLRKDASTVWVEVTASLVGSVAGDPEYVIVVVEDISARKEAEAKLKASEQRFRQVLLSSPLPMLVYDDTGRILAASRKWGEVAGYAPDDDPTIGAWAEKACREQRGKDDLIRSLLESEGEVRAELRAWTRRKEEKTLLIETAPLGEEPQERQLQILAAADVTEQQKIERELREASRHKDEFLAMLGHELRNPLAAIQTAARLFEMASDQPNLLQKAQGVLERQTKHMATLLDELLDISRVARGKIRLDRQVVDLVELVRSIVDDHADHIEQKRLELEVEVATSPIRVKGDPVRLAQVVDNLLSNAAKYTPAPGQIRVSLSREDGDAALCIVDTGVGIEPDLLPNIFDAFRQGRQGLDRSSGGLGLGLALVKELVELHGGRVSARSEGQGKGTAFTVRLPITLEQAAQHQPAVVGPRRILLVEDNRDAAVVLKALLESAGHQVALAAKGQEAIELVPKIRPDVVLCDLGLPNGVTGYDVARKLRSDPSGADISLIALTGYGRPEDKARSRQAGFDAHLTKPVDLDAIEALMADLRGKRPN